MNYCIFQLSHSTTFICNVKVFGLILSQATQGLDRMIFSESTSETASESSPAPKSATGKAGCILKAQSQQSGNFSASAKKYYSTKKSAVHLKKKKQNI